MKYKIRKILTHAKTMKETYLWSFEQSKRLQRAVNPALVLSMAPLCFIFKRTSKKWSPITLSCLKSSTSSCFNIMEALGSDSIESETAGKGTFLVIVPKRRLTCKRPAETDEGEMFTAHKWFQLNYYG